MAKQETSLTLDEFNLLLESKLTEISPGDFRFYNIARFPLLAKHSYNLSLNCDQCKSNVSVLKVLVDNLPSCLNDMQERKLFERNRDIVTKHLQKMHKIRFFSYHYSLYTFIGLLTGALIGIIIQVFYQHRIWTLLAISGASLGAIYGKRLERKNRKENRLM